MKTNCWLFALLGVALMAGRAGAGETAVVDKDTVLVRAQPTRFSEIVTRLEKGASVTVLEEISIEKPKPDDEARWARIALPAGVNVWVSALFIDSDSKTVKSRKLNLRAGPGENFSVLGTLENGATIKEVSTRGDWIEIEPPADAYAFIGANLIRKEAAATPPAVAIPEPAPVVETPVAAPATPIAETPVTTPPETVPAPIQPPVVEPVPTLSVPPPSLIEEPPVKRIVQREGVVKGTVSIQAPTHYELVSPVTGEPINYLYTTSTNLALKRYKGLRIIVTGEEGIDRRWPNTPVITIQRIQVVE